MEVNVDAVSYRVGVRFCHTLLHALARRWLPQHASAVSCGLQGEEVRVQSPGRHQPLVRSILYHPPPQHKNPIRHADDGEAVADQHRDASGRKLSEAPEDLVLGPGVKVLYQWQPRVDHGRKLPREDHDVPGGDTGTELDGELPLLLLDLDRDHLLLVQEREDVVIGGDLDLPYRDIPDGRTGSCPASNMNCPNRPSWNWVDPLRWPTNDWRST